METAHNFLYGDFFVILINFVPQNNPAGLSRPLLHERPVPLVSWRPYAEDLSVC
jgi:hypothetical protein